jgi:hypothetical protein
MRGGTVLHKVHLAPAARYSEDIDLVAVGDRPEGHIRKALLRVLRPVLGRERSSVWDSVQLAVRNAAKPSSQSFLLSHPPRCIRDPWWLGRRRHPRRRHSNFGRKRSKTTVASLYPSRRSIRFSLLHPPLEARR